MRWMALASVIVAIGVSGLDVQSAAPRGESEKAASPLARALQDVRKDLKACGRPEYAALLSEENVRASIWKGLKLYEDILEDQESLNPGTKAYYESLKPIYLSIAEEGAWPQNAEFMGLENLSEATDLSDGMMVRIRLKTRGDRPRAFALPVLDLRWGQ